MWVFTLVGMDVDKVFRVLSDVAARLSALPEDALEERFALRQRQEELRAVSRDLLARTGDILSADELRMQLRQLEAERDRFFTDTRMSHAAGGQTGLGSGIDPKYVHEMHRRMDEASTSQG